MKGSLESAQLLRITLPACLYTNKNRPFELIFWSLAIPSTENRQEVWSLDVQGVRDSLLNEKLWPIETAADEIKGMRTSRHRTRLIPIGAKQWSSRRRCKGQP